MTTKLAINTWKACYLMFEAGLNNFQVQKGINTINQPAQGYYYPTDIYNFINEVQNNDN